MLRGDSAAAQEHFLRTIERDPANVPARRLLAVIIERSDPREALRLCQQIRDIAPDTEGNDDCIRRTEARLKSSSAH
jgi:hypothetical protein